ncbi:hypothetical protein JTP77_025655 [Streptomyces sp. S9]|nr:hypothetical protein [Streptomyces sp. S9]
MLNLSDGEAREWAMSGVHVNGEADPPLPKPITPQPAPVLPAPAPAADPDVLADVQSPTPQAPALESLPASPSAPAPDDAVGLRTARAEHLPQITLAALRWARANAPDFPASVDKRGTDFLYPRR